MWSVYYQGEFLGTVISGDREQFVGAAVESGLLREDYEPDGIEFRPVNAAADPAVEEPITAEVVQELVARYIEQDIQKAVPVLTGLFTGAVESLISELGDDPEGEIVLNTAREIAGGEVRRRITLSEWNLGVDGIAGEPVAES